VPGRIELDGVVDAGFGQCRFQQRGLLGGERVVRPPPWNEAAAATLPPSPVAAISDIRPPMQ
jgi:hypothetical protein